MIEIPRTDDYFKNLERSGNGEYPPCLICGRGIRAKNPIMVHMFWGTHLVTEDEVSAIIANEGDGGDMYFNPIGPDCFRKHPELKAYAQ